MLSSVLHPAFITNRYVSPFPVNNVQSLDFLHVIPRICRLAEHHILDHPVTSLRCMLLFNIRRCLTVAEDI